MSAVVFDVERETLDKTLIQKSLTKLAVFPECKCPWMLCLALQPRQKIGPDLPFWVVLKLKLQKKKF